jgi:hypothetical protein
MPYLNFPKQMPFLERLGLLVWFIPVAFLISLAGGTLGFDE